MSFSPGGIARKSLAWQLSGILATREIIVNIRLIVQKTLTIIGAGKVGTTLARLWVKSSAFRLQEIMNASAAGTQRAIEVIGAGQAAGNYAELKQADVYLIATPDDRILPSCAALANAGKLTPASIVFHCSGALPSGVLQPAKEQGAAVASIHPIRSFASPDSVMQHFAGTWCGTEGDQPALDVLVPAFAAIGAQMVPIHAEAKIHYHAAAVFACNYLVTLLDVAQQSYQRAGIAPEIALQLMQPLVQETVDNVHKLGPKAALTGPIARGDLATARRQWQAVAAADAAHGELYKQFMHLTSDLVARQPLRKK